MDWKAFLKKYALWIGVAALAFYAVLKLRGGTASPRQALAPGAPSGASVDPRLELERLRAAGQIDLDRARLDAQLEALRRKDALDRFNIEQQILARNRALDAQKRQQTLGLIGQAIQGLASLFGRNQQQTTRQQGSMGSVGGSPGGGTAPTFPGRPQLPPYYPIPVPNINDLNPAYEPSYPQPEYLPLRVDDWGEAPYFNGGDMGLDTGATFYDQWGGNDFNYGYGFDYGDLYSGQPELTSTYDPYAGGGNIGLDDFYYGYGGGDYGYSAGGSDGGYSNIGLDDFNYGYGGGGYSGGEEYGADYWGD